MSEKAKRRTDDEVMNLLRDRDYKLSRARAKFSAGSARIERACQQRTPVGPIESCLSG